MHGSNVIEEYVSVYLDTYDSDLTEAVGICQHGTGASVPLPDHDFVSFDNGRYRVISP